MVNPSAVNRLWIVQAKMPNPAHHAEGSFRELHSFVHKCLDKIRETNCPKTWPVYGYAGTPSEINSHELAPVAVSG